MTAAGSNEFTYANTLDGYVERISTTLGDDETGHANATYSKEYLRVLICDAFVALSRIEKDLFPVLEVEFSIDTDTCMQKLPDECEEFLEWLRVEDSNGRKVPVMTGDYEAIKDTAFFPQPCRDCRGDVMSTVASYNAAFSSNSDRVFAFSPMVPGGIDVKIIALCRSIDNAVGDGTKELPQKLRAHAMLVQYLVLAMAVSKDDPVAYGAHMNSFFGLASYTQQQEALMQRFMVDRDR